MSAGVWKLQANTCREPGSFTGVGREHEKAFTGALGYCYKADVEKAKIKARYWETKSEELRQVKGPPYRGRRPSGQPAWAKCQMCPGVEVHGLDGLSATWAEGQGGGEWPSVGRSLSWPWCPVYLVRWEASFRFSNQAWPLGKPVSLPVCQCTGRAWGQPAPSTCALQRPRAALTLSPQVSSQSCHCITLLLHRSVLPSTAHCVAPPRCSFETRA